MADKAAEKNAGSKPGFFQRIAKSFRDLRGEMKKVVWPTKEAVIKNTIVVITVCVLVGVAIWVLDFGLTQSIKLLFGIGA